MSASVSTASTLTPPFLCKMILNWQTLHLPTAVSFTFCCVVNKWLCKKPAGSALLCILVGVWFTSTLYTAREGTTSAYCNDIHYCDADTDSASSPSWSAVIKCCRYQSADQTIWSRHMMRLITIGWRVQQTLSYTVYVTSQPPTNTIN